MVDVVWIPIPICAVLVLNFSLFHLLVDFCNFIPFGSRYLPTKNIQIFSGATAYTFDRIQETIIIWIHELLYFGDK